MNKRDYLMARLGRRKPSSATPAPAPAPAELTVAERVASMTVKEVLDAVAAEEMDAQEAADAEASGKARASLLDALGAA